MKPVLHIALAVACFASLSCSKAPPAGTGGSQAYARQVQVEDSALFSDLGLEAVCFEIRGEQDCRVTVWLETYMDGELAEHLTFGQYFVPAHGGTVTEKMRFTRLRDSSVKEDASSSVMWRLGSASSELRGSWMRDPLASMNNLASWHTNADNLVVGTTYTIWSLVASDSPEFKHGSRAMDIANPRVIYIMCRMDYPSMQRKAAESGTFVGLPPNNKAGYPLDAPSP